VAEPPGHLSLERHRNLAGRGHHIWTRRALLLALFSLPVLGLLNVFGQHPLSSQASGPAASLEVTAPNRLRGGLIYQGRFQIKARTALEEPTLVLDKGWFESMTLNALIPDPPRQDDRNGHTLLGFEPVPAGKSLTVWLYFQVNPTNVGHESQGVELRDGGTFITRVTRSVTIFP